MESSRQEDSKMHLPLMGKRSRIAVSMRIIKTVEPKRKYETYKNWRAQCCYMPNIDGLKQLTRTYGHMRSRWQTTIVIAQLQDKMKVSRRSKSFHKSRLPRKCDTPTRLDPRYTYSTRHYKYPVKGFLNGIKGQILVFI